MPENIALSERLRKVLDELEKVTQDVKKSETETKAA